MFQTLLDAGANPNVTEPPLPFGSDGNELRLLPLLADDGDDLAVQLLDMLIAAGVNVQDERALFNACKYGNHAFFTRMLQAGMCIDNIHTMRTILAHNGYGHISEMIDAVVKANGPLDLGGECAEYSSLLIALHYDTRSRVEGRLGRPGVTPGDCARAVSILVNEGVCLYTGRGQYTAPRESNENDENDDNDDNDDDDNDDTSWIATMVNYRKDERHGVMLRARRAQTAYFHARMLVCIARHCREETGGARGDGGGGSALERVLFNWNLLAHIVSYTFPHAVEASFEDVSRPSLLTYEMLTRRALQTGRGPVDEREMTATRKSIMRIVVTEG